MDWPFIGIGALIVILGIGGGIFDGASNFFFWWTGKNYIRRDKHPLLFWFCIGIHVVVGATFILLGVKG